MTDQKLFHGDARDLSFIPDKSVHLVLTSPPYFNLKEYRRGQNQLGIIDNYQEFIDELEKVWKECYRVLVPGGRSCASLEMYVYQGGSSVDMLLCRFTQILQFLAAK